MKKKIFFEIYLMCFLSIILLLSNDTKTNAAPNGKPLTTYPGVHLVSTTDFTSDKLIPEEYATVMRPSSKLSYTVSGNSGTDGGANSTSYYYSFNQRAIKSSTPCYLQANNVAIYKGNIIDVRINILPESTATDVYLYAPSYAPNKDMENFLRIDVRNRDKTALIEYEFYIHGTNEKIDFSGNWNYAWINNYKAITQPLDQITDIYAYDILPSARYTPVYYDTNFIPGDNITIYGKNGRQEFLKENAYTTLFNTTEGTLYQRIDVLGARGWTKYSATPITKMNLPSPQILGHTTDYSDIKFTANQDMNSQSREDFYPKKYTMYIKLKDANVMDWNNTNVAISDVTGSTNSTINNYFKVNKDIANNQLTIDVNQNTLKNTSFVNNSYFFEVSGKLKNTPDINKYYRTDGYFYIPVYVQYVTNDNTSVENMAYAKIKSDFTAIPITQIVPQGSSSKDWDTLKNLTDLFSECNPPKVDEDVIISKIENVTFSDLKDYSIKVTLKSKETGQEATFNVPIKVKAKKTAEINYIDTNGNKLSDPKINIGFEDQVYDFTEDIKDISNYKFLKIDDKSGSSSIKGKFPNASGASKITINVIYEILESKMTIKQVYKADQKLPIYKDIVNKEVVDNKGVTYNETIGTSIPSLIEQMKEKNKYGITKDFDWYMPIDAYKDYVILVDGKKIVTDKVPDKDFELLLVYTGITTLEVSDLNYGKIPISKENNKIYDNPNTNQNIKIVNTTLSQNWNLSVSLEKNIIRNIKTNESYLGGLLVKNGSNSNYITDQDYIFFKNEDLASNLLSTVPMDIKLYQNTGNRLGSYQGNVVWTLQDIPKT